MTHDDTFENLQKKIGKKLELDESDMAIDLHHHKGEKLDDHKGRIMYKWIAAESELQEKIWAGLATVGQAGPNFILQFIFGLQFTFICNSLVHDPVIRAQKSWLIFLELQNTT